MHATSSGLVIGTYGGPRAFADPLSTTPRVCGGNRHKSRHPVCLVYSKKRLFNTEQVEFRGVRRSTFSSSYSMSLGLFQTAALPESSATGLPGLTAVRYCCAQTAGSLAHMASNLERAAISSAYTEKINDSCTAGLICITSAGIFRCNAIELECSSHLATDTVASTAGNNLSVVGWCASTHDLTWPARCPALHAWPEQPARGLQAALVSPPGQPAEAAPAVAKPQPPCSAQMPAEQAQQARCPRRGMAAAAASPCSVSLAWKWCWQTAAAAAAELPGGAGTQSGFPQADQRLLAALLTLCLRTATRNWLVQPSTALCLFW